MSRTHTFAELQISPQAYAEIKKLLQDCGYNHVFVGDAIDMHGIGLVTVHEEVRVAPQGMYYARKTSDNEPQLYIDCRHPKHQCRSNGVCLTCNRSDREEE